MKLVLLYLDTPINEISKRVDWVGESLSISYLTAVLEENGFDVTPIDGSGERLTSKQVYLRTKKLHPDFVGISVTHETISEALKIAQKLKKGNPDIHICFGGHHATLAAEQILESEANVDSIVRGEGEETIVELARALYSGNSMKKISGIWFRDSVGKIRKNPDRKPIANISDLPFPTRSLSIYKNQRPELVTARIYSSRGCLYNCAFCSTPAFLKVQSNHAQWRARSAENIVDEIQYLNKEFGYSDFSICDDNAVSPLPEAKERMRQICREIIVRNLKITAFIMCSALTFGPEDEDLLWKMKEAGIERILIGIEAGSRETLRIYNKPATLEQNIKAVEFLSQFGFALMCSTISIHPYSTIEEIKENYSFIKFLMDKQNVGMFAPYCTQLEVFPGASIFERVKEDKLILAEKPYLEACSYIFVHPEVQFLANILHEVESTTVQLDWLIWDIRRFVLRKLNEKNSLNGNTERFTELKRQCFESILEINNVNFQFFNSCLEYADQNDIETSLKEKEDYVNKIKQFEQILDQKYGLLKECFNTKQKSDQRKVNLLT